MKLAKRIIALIAALVCVFGLFACGTEAVAPKQIQFEHITVDADTVNEIKTAYIVNFLDDSCVPDDIDMEIYGEYDGAYVFYALSRMHGYAAVVCYEAVDDLAFIYSCGEPLHIYRDGEIMRLQEACDSGVINHDNLIDIGEKYGDFIRYTDESDIGYCKI